MIKDTIGLIFLILFSLLFWYLYKGQAKYTSNTLLPFLTQHSQFNKALSYLHARNFSYRHLMFCISIYFHIPKSDFYDVSKALKRFPNDTQISSVLCTRGKWFNNYRYFIKKQYPNNYDGYNHYILIMTYNNHLYIYNKTKGTWLSHYLSPDSVYEVRCTKFQTVDGFCLIFNDRSCFHFSFDPLSSGGLFNQIRRSFNYKITLFE